MKDHENISTSTGIEPTPLEFGSGTLPLSHHGDTIFIRQKEPKVILHGQFELLHFRHLSSSSIFRGRQFEVLTSQSNEIKKQYVDTEFIILQVQIINIAFDSRTLYTTSQLATN